MKQCLLVLCAMLAVGCAARHNFQFHVRFDQAVRLKAGDEVCMRGVPVGKVERVSLTQLPNSNQMAVDVAVLITDSKVQVRKGDTFRTETAGLLGQDYLEIDPVCVQSPPIAPGGAVTGERNATAFSPKLLANLQPVLEIAGKLAALPPDERKSMLDKFLKLLDQAQTNKKSDEPGKGVR